MKTKTLKVSLGFTSGTQQKLEETAAAVLDELFDKPAFADPPVTKVELQASYDAFRGALVLRMQGGPAATAEKNNRKVLLTDQLKQLAYHVQIKCGNDLATLLSSGFEATSANTTRSQLRKPDPVSVKNGLSGQMIVKTGMIDNAVCYEVEVAAVDAQGQPGEWTGGGLHTKSSAITVNNLTPGVLYVFRIRAVGGLTGYSDWSNIVTGRSL